VLAHLVATVGPVAGVVGFYLRLSGLPIAIAEHALPVYLGHRWAASPPGLAAAWLGLIALSVAGTTNPFLLGRWLGPARTASLLARLLRIDETGFARIDDWYRRWAWATLMVGAQVPGARVPIIVAAGALGVRYRVFAASIAVAMAPRLALLLWVGVSFGSALADYLTGHPYVYVALSALAALVLVQAALRIRRAWAASPAGQADQAGENKAGDTRHRV
jgi:membrane protein DedA with SNARE-associated domain